MGSPCTDGCLSPQDLAQQRETNLKRVQGCIRAVSSDALRPPPHLSTCPGSSMGLAFVSLPATRKAVEAKRRCQGPACMGQGAWGLLPYCKMKGKKKKTPECDPGKSSPKKWSRRGGFPSNEAAQGVRAILAGGDTVRVGSPGTAPLQRSV